jgi:hypothetical protein
MNTTTAKGKGAPKNANDAALIVEPLTIAYPGELVVYTPKTILSIQHIMVDERFSSTSG